MQRGTPSSRHSDRRSIATIVIVALAFCAVVIPAAAVAGSPGAGPGTAAGSLDSSLPSDFAARAGYSTLDASQVSGTAPAGGLQDIAITFESTSPALYDAPAAGSAPMTTAEVANAFGLSVPAYTAAEQYFESEGLSVLHTWPDRLSLSLQGTPAAIDRAFGTSLVSGVYDGRTVTYPTIPPSLPPALEAEVESVSGLSTGFDEFTLPSTPAPETPSGGTDPAQNPPDLITPSIARDIYDVSGLYNLTSSPTYATGKGIVLLLWGLGYAPNDIQTFFSQDYPANFPAPTIVPYPVDGAPNPSANAVNDPSNGSRELTLDLEWSGSMAPGATLDAVYAPPGPGPSYSPTDASMIDALNLAVDRSSIPDVAAISMSFGSADGADSTLTNGFESDFAVAAQEHITLFAATGDTGGDAGAGCTGGPQPEYPSASPQVVAVGGTAVSLDRSVLGAITGFSESAWSEGGGGFSAQFAAPSWQEVGSAAAPIEANGHRGLPDVAATAGYNFLYYDGQPAAGGGTSFATPLWAGMVTEMDALRGSNFGFLDPALYQLAANQSGSTAPFNDITSGANCIGSAGPGWDTATGWGSPVGVLLYEHLVSSFVNLSVTATPSPVAPGGALTIVVTVTNATSHVAIPGLPVLVSLASNVLAGPCSGTWASVTPVSNSSGVVIVTISIPGCYLGSGAVAAVMVAAHGYYGMTTTSVDVNLLGLDPGLAWLAQYPNNVVLFVLIMGVAIAIGAVLGRQRASPGRATSGPPVAPNVVAPPPEPSTAPAAPPVSAGTPVLENPPP